MRYQSSLRCRQVLSAFSQFIFYSARIQKMKNVDIFVPVETGKTLFSTMGTFIAYNILFIFSAHFYQLLAHDMATQTTDCATLIRLLADK